MFEEKTESPEKRFEKLPSENVFYKFVDTFTLYFGYRVVLKSISIWQKKYSDLILSNR